MLLNSSHGFPMDLNTEQLSIKHQDSVFEFFYDVANQKSQGSTNYFRQWI